MKYLGLDVGKKTIGLAKGELLASELTTLRSPKNQDFYSEPGCDAAYRQIGALIDEHAVQALVIGLPTREDGTPSEESKRISLFIEGLKGRISTPVYTVDETLTSFMARDMLESQGVSTSETELRIDQLSAQLILQQYLEENAVA